MVALIELACECGAKHRIPADQVAAGRVPPCRACGGPLHPPTAETAPPTDAAAADSPKPEVVRSEPAEALSLCCPNCGGECEVVYRGPKGRDRMLECSYCGTEVDLPEAHGVTRERVTSRPNERIVERVTEWKGVAPELGGSGPLPSWRENRGGVGESSPSIQAREVFEVNGRRFDSREAFEKHLRDTLPADMAKAVLSRLAPGARTSVVEQTSWTFEKSRVGSVGVRGSRSGGLLGAVRRLFKRSG